MKNFWGKIKTGILILILSVTIFLIISTVVHHAALKAESGSLIPPGELVEVNGHNIHVFADGDIVSEKTLVFMSGSATVAPVYDFKILYNSLSDSYRIVVVEKAGYGYSEIYKTNRDIDSLLDEMRTALQLAGEAGPYVLLPHSISGLEAIYWAKKYPDEVEAIIGLDMSTPGSYENFNFSKMNRFLNLGRIAVFMGLHRIPGVYPLETDLLSKDEIRQQKFLANRNAVNINYVIEAIAVQRNTDQVREGALPEKLPLLMFTSNGKDIGDFWIPSQEAFAAENHAEHIMLDCGHYMHHNESEIILENIVEFLNMLPVSS